MSRLILAGLVFACACHGQGVTVGSKKFTESVVLGEMLRLRASQAGSAASHRASLGSTRVVFEALRSGEIDIYPEYTGTLRLDVLRDQELKSDADLPAALAELGLRMSPPLGFANSYGIAAKESWAAERNLSKLSDLAALPPETALGCSNEFLGRGDGFPALRAAYGLQLKARPLDHDLAYAGLAADAFPLMVVYTTEPEIRYHQLRVLDDDRAFFPRYDAVLVYRQELEGTPALTAMLELCGRLDNETMIGLNLEAKPPEGSGRTAAPENVVADRFLASVFGGATTEVALTWWQRLVARTGEQLLMVVTSLLLAIFIALPLGILAAKHRRFGQVVLGASGVLQTVPSLALLVFLIPWLGLGAVPAIAALFVYSLLPIVRNTHAGLTGIAPELRESAAALGLPSRVQLWRVELPLAAPSIFAGIKTAAVLNIGTATLGAFIDAGGYGLPILNGIRLNDYGRVLQGAVPAALMAVVAQATLEAVERMVVSRGLRL